LHSGDETYTRYFAAFPALCNHISCSFPDRQFFHQSQWTVKSPGYRQGKTVTLSFRALRNNHEDALELRAFSSYTRDKWFRLLQTSIAENVVAPSCRCITIGQDTQLHCVWVPVELCPPYVMVKRRDLTINMTLCLAVWALLIRCYMLSHCVLGRAPQTLGWGTTVIFGACVLSWVHYVLGWDTQALALGHCLFVWALWFGAPRLWRWGPVTVLIWFGAPQLWRWGPVTVLICFGAPRIWRWVPVTVLIWFGAPRLWRWGQLLY
jgi:hypothetical protein